MVDLSTVPAYQDDHDAMTDSKNMDCGSVAVRRDDLAAVIALIEQDHEANCGTEHPAPPEWRDRLARLRAARDTESGSHDDEVSQAMALKIENADDHVMINCPDGSAVRVGRAWHTECRSVTGDLLRRICAYLEDRGDARSEQLCEEIHAATGLATGLAATEHESKILAVPQDEHTGVNALFGSIPDLPELEEPERKAVSPIQLDLLRSKVEASEPGGSVTMSHELASVLLTVLTESS